MADLLIIQFKRLNRQKLIYLYFVVMTSYILSNGIQLTSKGADEAGGYYAGGMFPIYCVQCHIDIIGPLFLAFICAFLISGERAAGMFKQPLLAGISKKELITVKTFCVIVVAFTCFLFTILLSAVITYIFWKNQLFTNIFECFLRFLLLAIPHITISLFWVLLSLYIPNIPGMLCASLIILLVNNLFSQFFEKYISAINFMYYFYAFSGYNGIPLKQDVITTGIIVNTITAFLFIVLITRRMKHITL